MAGIAEAGAVFAAPVDPALQKAAVNSFVAALEEAADEQALGQVVEEFVEARLAGTRLDVTLSGRVLSGKTAGGKTFTGQNAPSGSATGTGYLDKSSTTIYTATTKYEFKPGTLVNSIYFYDAAGKKVGTWSGKLLPTVSQAFQGAGAFKA